MTTFELTIPRTLLEPGDQAVLETSIDLLRKAGACTNRFLHLLDALGYVTAADLDLIALAKVLQCLTDEQRQAPINLLTILGTNGTEDCLWALSATSVGCDRQARLMAADFAEMVLPLSGQENPEDSRPRAAIETARCYARGATSDAARAAAWSAAWSAARAATWSAATWSAARAAAKDAAWSAANDAAWSAARDAAWSAARAAAWFAAKDAAWNSSRAAAWDSARDDQAEIIRRYLLPSGGGN